ncbi:MAG TPA: glycosyltransferase [Dongiaceae bacterium]
MNKGADQQMEADSRPFWSVMIPCWNPDPRLLRETIESVLAAGIARSQMQIALVDDGSPHFDGAGFLGKAGFTGVEFHGSDVHHGIAGNWNRCLALARGRWLHILHQDDRIRPGFYAAMARGIDREPSIGAAFCQHVFIDEAGALVRRGHMPDRPAGILYDWLTHVFVNLTIQCAAIVLRGGVPEALGGFDPGLVYALDADMWQRLALAYPIWYEPEALAEQRLHATSQSSALQNTRRKRREIALIQQRMEARLAPADARWARPWARQASLRIALSAIRQAIAVRRRRAAVHELLGCLRILRPLDIWSVIRGHYPPDLTIAHAANRRAGSNEPRILLASEFIPFDIDLHVFGAFLRLRVLIDAAMKTGPANILFFWPKPEPPDQADAEALLATVEKHWGFQGAIWLCPAGLPGERRRFGERVADQLWQWRGAVGFFDAKPNMRTCGARQAALLRMILHAVKPDLAVCDALGAQAAFRRADLAYPPLLADYPNLEHVRMARRGAVLPGLRGRLGALATALIARHAESRLAPRAARAAVCSQTDRDRLARLAPGLPISVIPNVIASVSPVPLGDEPIAVFVGIMLYPPNREALALLRQEIWPLVRRGMPQARLLVAGEGGERLVQANDAAEGIEMLGFVKDLAPLYARARLTAVAIRRGSGTRFKIVESAVHGRPCVSTTIGAEGLLFRDGESILLRDSMVDFADACIRLLADKDYAQRIGDAALAMAHNDYDRDAAVALASRAMRDVLDTQGAGRAPEV